MRFLIYYIGIATIMRNMKVMILEDKKKLQSCLCHHLHDGPNYVKNKNSTTALSKRRTFITVHLQPKGKR